LNSVNLFSHEYPSVDLQDNTAWTPLAHAISGKHLEIVEFLLSQNADPRAQSSGGVSLHHLAIDQKFGDAAAALIKYGAEPDVRHSQLRRVRRSSTLTRNLYDVPRTRYTNRSEIPFKFLNRLGVGAFGIVDSVYSRNDPSVVVVRKTIPLREDSWERMLEESKHEVGIMQTLVHSHIERAISTYDVGTRENPREFCFLMLPVGEEDLDRYFKRMEGESNPGELKRLEGWMMFLATALAYMHSRQIRHCDIKPSNIIRNGEMLYFIDFGISTGQTDSDGYKQNAYSLQYTSPALPTHSLVSSSSRPSTCEAQSCSSRLQKMSID